MKLVIVLIAVHIGCITSKAIYPNFCDDPPENDYRSKINKDKGFTKTEIIQSQRKPAHHYETYNNDKIEGNNPNVPQRLVLNLNSPINTASEAMNINNKNLTPYPVFYGKVDPKLIITSQLYNPNSNRRSDKIKDVSDVDDDETMSIDLIRPNFSSSNGTDEQKSEKLVTKAEETDDLDDFNIRELREHLLDHLLDYFLNILKDDQHNETIKRSGKDHMKVEDKLRNYYDPHHIDLFIDEDEELDNGEKRNYKDKNMLQSQFYASPENYTELHDIIENTEHDIQNNNNSQLYEAWSLGDLDFEITSNAEALHNSTKLITDEVVTNKDAVTLEKKIMEDDDDSSEEVFITTNVVTTTQASLTITTDDTVNTDLSTKYEDIKENSTEDDQIDEFMYNDDIDEYQQKNDDNKTIEQHYQEFNSEKDHDIEIQNNDTSNGTKNELGDAIYDNFKTFLSNINANKSIQFIVHLHNVDSSQLDGDEPVNITQILTMLKDIKQNYNESGNNTKHTKNNGTSKYRGHCKKNILLNLNINVV